MSTDPTGMLADQLNATQTMGPQGAMSGSGDYSFMWGNDTMELSAEHAVAQDVVAQTGTDDQRQKLIKAQDAARTDPSLQPKVGADGKSIEATFCNIGLVKQAADVGASLAPLVDSKGTPLLANQQAKNLAQSSDYKEISAKEAQRLADNGVIVIAAAGNASGHGHVATVRPQNVAGDSPTGRNGPIINNIGAHNEIRRESAAFPPSMTPKYYVPASSQ